MPYTSKSLCILWPLTVGICKTRNVRNLGTVSVKTCKLLGNWMTAAVSQIQEGNLTRGREILCPVQQHCAYSFPFTCFAHH